MDGPQLVYPSSMDSPLRCLPLDSGEQASVNTRVRVFVWTCASVLAGLHPGVERLGQGAYSQFNCFEELPNCFTLFLRNFLERDGWLKGFRLSMPTGRTSPAEDW